MSKKNISTKLKNKYTVVLVAAFALIGVSFLVYSNASTPRTTRVSSGSSVLSLTPATGSFGPSAQFSVSLYVDSGSEAINTVEAKIKYDPSKVSFVSKNNSGGALDTCIDSPETSNSSGLLSFACTKLGSSITGKKKVANLSFKTKTSPGSFNLAFRNDSGVYASSNNQDVWNGNNTGGSYSVSASGGGGSSSGGGSNSGGGGSSSSDGSSGGSSGSSSTPSTSSPSSSGGSSSAGSGGSTGSSSGPIATPSTEPVSGSNQGGNTESILIKVVDAENQPVVGAKVVLRDVEATTDSQGIARYFGVTAGAYTITVTTDEGESRQKINVKDNSGSSDAQEFNIQVKPKSPILYYLTVGGLAILAIAGLIAAIIGLKKMQKRAHFRRTHGLDQHKAVVFDSNSSKQPKPSKVDQGPMVNFSPASPKVDKPEASKPVAPSAPASSSEPTPGNVITPEDKK